MPWGILIGGEELHNNHHSFATSAKLSAKWYEFDIGWMYIRLLELLGLAKVKKTIPRPRFGEVKPVPGPRHPAGDRDAPLRRDDALRAFAARGLRRRGAPAGRGAWAGTERVGCGAGCWVASCAGWTTPAQAAEQAVEASQALRTVAAMRGELAALWSRSNASREGCSRGCRTGWRAPSAAASVRCRSFRCGYAAMRRVEGGASGATRSRRASASSWGVSYRRTLQPEVVAVGVAIGRVEDAEASAARFSAVGTTSARRSCGGDRGQVEHQVVAPVGQGRRGPRADDVFVGDALDVGEVHHHAVDRYAVGPMMSPDSVTQRVAVAVQMPALAGVVRNPVSGVEFEAAGDAHGGSLGRLGYSTGESAPISRIFRRVVGKR